MATTITEEPLSEEEEKLEDDEKISHTTRRKPQLRREVVGTPQKSDVRKSGDMFISPETKDRKSLIEKNKSSPVTPGTKASSTKKKKKASLRQSRLEERFRISSAKVQASSSSSRSRLKKTSVTVIQERDLKRMYSLNQKMYGALGGGGSGGAIYGEITQESFQKVLDVFVQKCQLNTNSVFLDIGSGLGKPNFHVVVYPGVKLSLGVELIGTRWMQSISLLKACLRDTQLKQYGQKTWFGHCDANKIESFEPVTHIHTFNKGIPPETMTSLAQTFNTSESTQYISCFSDESKIAKYGFNVELVDIVPTSMAGSGEHQRCFIYKKKSDIKPKPGTIPTTARQWKVVKPPTSGEFATTVPHSESYQDGMKAMSSGDTAYENWVAEQYIRHYESRRTTRSTRRSARLTKKK